MTAVATAVSAVVVHALVTYSLLLGSEHVLHKASVFTADVYVLPAVHAVHTALVPVTLALPGT